MEEADRSSIENWVNNVMFIKKTDIKK
jgi:hypothetical protein